MSTSSTEVMALGLALLVAGCASSTEAPRDTTPVDGCGVPIALPAEPTCGSAGERVGANSPTFPGLFDGCRHVLGTVSLEDTPFPDVDFLETVEHVDGDLNLFRNRSLVDISGLRNLVSVEQLTIRNSYELTSLEPLGRLRQVRGMFYVASLSSLTSLRGLEGLQCVGRLILNVPEGITDISPLSSLHTVDGDLSVGAAGVGPAALRAWVDGIDVGGTVELNGEVYVSP